jgi:hypothetical protein
MPNEPDSEHDADEIATEPERLGPSDERSDASARTGNARAPHTPADASHWTKSLRDVHFTWNERGRAGESARPPGDDWWRLLQGELHTEIDAKPTSDITDAATPDTPEGEITPSDKLPEPNEANRDRDTLEIIDSNEGEGVEPDLPGRQDVPSQAPVPAVNEVEDDTANSPPSTRRTRRRLRRRSRKKGSRTEGNGEARPGTDDEAADNVNTVWPQRFEDDPAGALDDLRAKVAELGYQLAYAGRTFRAPVTKRTYHIVDREKRERIDAFGSGTVDLTLLDVCLWSEQAFKKANDP